jgi:hypothetical protein
MKERDRILAEHRFDAALAAACPIDSTQEHPRANQLLGQGQ